MWEKIANTILRNRQALIIFLVIATGLMLYKATQVQLAYDNPKFVPNDDPDYVAYEAFKKTFGDDGSVMVVGINTPKIREYEFFSDWYDLTAELDSRDNIKRVLSIANLKNLKKTETYNYFENDSFKAEVFSVVDFLESKPKSQEELDAYFKSLEDLKFYKGLLFKDSSDFTLIALTLEKSILDTKSRVPFVNKLTKRIQDVCKKHDVETHISGLPFIRTKMSQMIQQELVRFTLVSMLLTSLILWFFFRS